MKTVSAVFSTLCLAAAMLLLASVSAFAQGGDVGSIVGSVFDKSGGALAGSTVTVIDTQRGVTRTLTADDAGQYSAPNLTPGTYTVRAEYKGFQSIERQNILIQVGTQIRVDLTLQPGEQSQTITVTEEMPLVETTNAVLGGALNNQLISDLPLNGRNFNRRTAGETCPVLLADAGGRTSEPPAVREHAGLYCPIASAAGINARVEDTEF